MMLVKTKLLIQIHNMMIMLLGEISNIIMGTMQIKASDDNYQYLLLTLIDKLRTPNKLRQNR